MWFLKLGDLFDDRYRIQREIGAGGMSYVYAAHDEELQQTVALKIIKPEMMRDEELVKRFKREVLIARQLQHPNIIRIFEFGRAAVEDRSFYYLTMELLDGEDLAHWNHHRWKISLDEGLEIALQLCDAVGEAHRCGVVHRDIKPQNIFIDTEGSAKLMDFGISRLDTLTGMTRGSQMIGTPRYMSPEQMSPQGNVDQRSDIYSLGVVVYQLVTKRTPFEGETPVQIAYQLLQDTPPAPRQFNPQVPQALEKLILKCLEKDPAQRYQSVDDIRSDLLGVLGSLKKGGEEADISEAPTVVVAVASDKAPISCLPSEQLKSNAPPEQLGSKPIPNPSVSSKERLPSVDEQTTRRKLSKPVTSAPALDVGVVQPLEPDKPAGQSEGAEARIHANRRAAPPDPDRGRLQRRHRPRSASVPAEPQRGHVSGMRRWAPLGVVVLVLLCVAYLTLMPRSDPRQRDEVETEKGAQETTRPSLPQRANNSRLPEPEPPSLKLDSEVGLEPAEKTIPEREARNSAEKAETSSVPPVGSTANAQPIRESTPKPAAPEKQERRPEPSRVSSKKSAAEIAQETKVPTDTLSESASTARVAKPASKTGTLVLQSSPSAKILLDGETVGTTPQTLEVSTGRHQIILTTNDGVRIQETVEIKPGELLNFSRKLDVFGSLSVTSAIWVEVSLDGGASEQTPIFFPRVIAGRHRVRAFRAGYKEQVTEVIIKNGKTSNVNLTMEKQP